MKFISVCLPVLLCCLVCHGFPQVSEKKTKDPKNQIHNLLHPTTKRNSSDTALPKPTNKKGVPIDSHSSEQKVSNSNGSENTTTADDNSKNNGTHPEPDTFIDIIIVEENKDNGESVRVENDDKEDIEEDDDSSLVMIKTTRVQKVEEVFEDLLSQSVRRVIKEDKVVKIEVINDRHMETIDSNFMFKDIISE